MRMAEMRKGELQGRALRQSGKKGPSRAVPRPNKGFVGRGSQMLATIPECGEFSPVAVVEIDGDRRADGVDRDSGEVLAGKDAVMLEGLISGGAGPLPDCPILLEETTGEDFSIQPWKKEPMQDGVTLDLALDLMSAQPLQEMGFVGEQVIPAVVGDGKKDCLLLGSKQMEGMVVSNGADREKDYPLLSKESLAAAREKDRNRGTGGTEGLMGADKLFKGSGSKNKEAQNGGQSSKVDGHKGFGSRNYKASLFDGGHSQGNLPVSFEPEKIRKMGVTGECSGLPSIQFSGMETSFLAEKMGYAVVGKFSHSIPSSLHLQKAFMGMKFLGEFSWKYINAKHVLVQFHLIDDYAKLLSGPNGMPV